MILSSAHDWADAAPQGPARSGRGEEPKPSPTDAATETQLDSCER